MSDNQAYVASISYNSYGPQSKGTGTINIRGGAAYMSIDLDEDDASQLRELAARIVDKYKRKFADAIVSIDVTPMLTYDAAKTIDDEVPY